MADRETVVEQVRQRVKELVALHGSVRGAAPHARLSHEYLRALLNGTYTNPSPDAMEKLGLPRELACTEPIVNWPAEPEGIEWRPVVGCEGLYSVSNDGRVRSEPRMRAFGDHMRQVGGQIIASTPKADGYRDVALANDRKTVYRQVHQLVLEAFVGPCPAGMQGCHNDGVPANCNLSNLRWDTPQANSLDKNAHGTMVKGTSHHLAKLTDDQVRAIRIDGRVLGEIAAQYGISKKQASRIRRRESWAWL